MSVYKTKGNVDTLIATSNCYFNNLDISNYRLEIIPGNFSGFNTKSNTVLLSKNHIKRANRTIAHEVCHLNMAKLTLNANILENNRFWDEGFANIFAYQVIEELEKYKNRSIQISIQQLQNNNLSIDKVRNWDSYYDRNGKRNYYAYNVGSSFIFYLFDSYGIKKVLQVIKLNQL